MSGDHFRTGFGKLLIYLRIAFHVSVHYGIRPGHFHWSPAEYLRFLLRALRLLLLFRHNKVVHVSGGWKLHLYLPAYPSRAFFYAIESKLLRRPVGPTTVVYSMTKACGYRCPHCYQKEDTGADLDDETLQATAGLIQDSGVAMFDIEGGEPFLRFRRLLELVQVLDDRSEIWVNSSGDKVTLERLEQLKDAGLFGLMVSVHSPSPERHDGFTGIPGSFDTALSALRLCRGLGLATAFNTVLSEEEIRNGGLPKLMDLARDSECDYVQLIHPKPSGGWLGRETEMQTSASIIQRVRNAHVMYNGPGAVSYPSLAAQVFEESEELFGCTAGAVDRFYVNANGEVQPCEFLNISFGNVRDEAFGEIFTRMRAHFSVPCSDWLCCTQGEAINECFRQNDMDTTPLPWPLTRELTDHWDRGSQTEAYRKLGIYSE